MNLEVALLEAEKRISNPDLLIRAVLSGRRRNMTPSSIRIDIRPFNLKEQMVLQVASSDGIRTATKNYLATELDILQLLSSGYANILVETKSESLNIRMTKKGEALVYEEKIQLEQNLKHDKVKQRLLDPSDPYLVEIGISDRYGTIKPSRQRKFRQVEEFLRVLAPTLNSAISAGQIAAPTQMQPLEILDLGCGHAYLTFAAHQYLKKENLAVHIIGIDMREESRVRNVGIAAKLGIAASMEFRAEEIVAAARRDVDIAIALHACDTATDDALAWAVKNGARIILAAPCCHHDLQTQMKQVPDPWGLVTRNGLLKERLGDILTDAIRAQILRLLGYRVDTLEFVADEHTPRNLMIRAVKTNAKMEPSEYVKYQQLLTEWNFRPALAERLKWELSEVVEN